MVLLKVLYFSKSYFVLNQQDTDIIVLSLLFNGLTAQFIPAQGNVLGLLTLYAFAL